MGGAIWAIFYDLGKEGREAYLNWFHDVHIPEKLARPGYVSAGHYEIVDADGAPASANGESNSTGAAGYVALFGGEDTSVFLNPSPAQIKPNQTEETRLRMGQRIGSRSFIAAREWGYESPAAGFKRSDDAIVLSCCDTPEHDEDFGAYCVQDLKAALSGHTDFRSLTKYLATVGPMKHATLASFSSLEGAIASAGLGALSEWSVRMLKAQALIAGSPLTARRIWPS